MHNRKLYRWLNLNSRKLNCTREHLYSNISMSITHCWSVVKLALLMQLCSHIERTTYLKQNVNCWESAPRWMKCLIHLVLIMRIHLGSDSQKLTFCFWYVVLSIFEQSCISNAIFFSVSFVGNWVLIAVGHRKDELPIISFLGNSCSNRHSTMHSNIIPQLNQHTARNHLLWLGL